MGNQRITSIDALRAVTLFGILLVHASVIFSFVNPTNTFEQSRLGNITTFLISECLQFRCNKIFGILFGVSFYLMLKNPNYSPIKFVWRCFLLMCIGLINKFFYTVDALMWYGFWGIILVLFRKFSPRWLFVCFCTVFIISSISKDLGCFKLVSDHNPMVRYHLPTSLASIMSYPVLTAVKDYLVVVSNDPFSCLWQFLLGYYFAKKGIIENIKKHASKKNIISFGLLYIICFFLKQYHLFVGLRGFVTNCTWLFGAIFYSLVFLWLYYRYYPKFKFLDAYGKLGLTNYSLQGILGVIFSVGLFIPNRWGIELVYLASVLLFFLQLLLSNLWLRYFTNGPLEWIWRCLTNLKITSPIVEKNRNV